MSYQCSRSIPRLSTNLSAALPSVTSTIEAIVEDRNLIQASRRRRPTANIAGCRRHTHGGRTHPTHPTAHANNANNYEEGEESDSKEDRVTTRTRSSRGRGRSRSRSMGMGIVRPPSRGKSLHRNQRGTAQAEDVHDIPRPSLRNKRSKGISNSTRHLERHSERSASPGNNRHCSSSRRSLATPMTKQNTIASASAVPLPTVVKSIRRPKSVHNIIGANKNKTSMGILALASVVPNLFDLTTTNTNTDSPSVTSSSTLSSSSSLVSSSSSSSSTAATMERIKTLKSFQTIYQQSQKGQQFHASKSQDRQELLQKDIPLLPSNIGNNKQQPTMSTKKNSAAATTA